MLDNVHILGLEKLLLPVVIRTHLKNSMDLNAA